MKSIVDIIDVKMNFIFNEMKLILVGVNLASALIV